MLIIGLIFNIYQTYQILGRKNTSEQQSKIMSQLIILTIIWEMLIYNDISNLNNQDQIQMEGMQKINEITQIMEIFLLNQVQIILQQYTKSEIKSELFLILMTNLIGQLNQQESYDLILTITAWEQLNQSQYQLVTMGQYKKTQSQSGGQKYFQLSAQTTGFLQMGISQIYSNTGTMSIDIQKAIQLYMEKETESQKIGQQQQSVPQMQKQAAAPFHNWAPDLYDAIPTPIVQWIALLPKQGILIQQFNLAPILLTFREFYQIIAIISVIIGSITLSSQWKIKRFLAYSAIAHIGFLQIAYITISPIIYFNYIIIYMLTSQQIFIILQALNQRINGQQTSPYFKEQAGLLKKNFSQGIAQAISQFSLAGIPPLSGFFAKQLIQESILSEYQIDIALILIQTSAISTGNYLSIIKQILLDLSRISSTTQSLTISLTTISAYLISVLSSQIQLYFMKPYQYITQLFF